MNVVSLSMLIWSVFTVTISYFHFNYLFSTLIFITSHHTVNHRLWTRRRMGYLISCECNQYLPELWFYWKIYTRHIENKWWKGRQFTICKINLAYRLFLSFSLHWDFFFSIDVTSLSIQIWSVFIRALILLKDKYKTFCEC